VVSYSIVGAIMADQDITALEGDVADLTDLVRLLSKSLLDSRMELHALVGVLIDRYGLSPKTFEEYVQRARSKADELRAEIERVNARKLSEGH
jgi:hypothetical protein